MSSSKVSATGPSMPRATVTVTPEELSDSHRTFGSNSVMPGGRAACWRAISAMWLLTRVTIGVGGGPSSTTGSWPVSEVRHSPGWMSCQPARWVSRSTEVNTTEFGSTAATGSVSSSKPRSLSGSGGATSS